MSMKLFAPVIAAAALGALAAPAAFAEAPSSRVQAAGKPKGKVTFSNKHGDAFFELGPCKGQAYFRYLNVSTGYAPMTASTREYKGPDGCRYSVKLRYRAKKDGKLHYLTSWRKKDNARVTTIGKRCWSEHTIEYAGAIFRTHLIRDKGTKC